MKLFSGLDYIALLIAIYAIGVSIGEWSMRKNMQGSNQCVDGTATSGENLAHSANMAENAATQAAAATPEALKLPTPSCACECNKARPAN